MIKYTKDQQSHLIHNYVVPWVFSYVNDELIEEIVKHNCFFLFFFPLWTSISVEGGERVVSNL